MTKDIVLFWFRRDLRLDDNVGLYQALTSGYSVLPVFIFDKQILNKFTNPRNKQVEFIYNQIIYLQKKLVDIGSTLIVGYDTPEAFFENITHEYNIKAVYTNEDYEPDAIIRDNKIATILQKQNISFLSFKDQVIFAKDDILKKDQTPYTVFTPYRNSWKDKFDFNKKNKIHDTLSLTNNFARIRNIKTTPSLSDLGYITSGLIVPSDKIDDNIILNYDKFRDYPATDGTSHLSVHLRFGTISIRKLVNKAIELNDTFLNELIWREFYFGITWHFPHIFDGKSFKKEYDNIQWQNNETDFEAWCAGKTGYPIVDAGMRQLNTTGYMHNRVRMITASFLIKNLLIDWRWGEDYFRNNLIDYDFSANNGGWQWVAGSGCDAAPYFRIFNPEAQRQKFDPENKYIERWIPEINTSEYPLPIVDLKVTRHRAIEKYYKALSKTEVNN